VSTFIEHNAKQARDIEALIILRNNLNDKIRDLKNEVESLKTRVNFTELAAKKRFDRTQLNDITNLIKGAKNGERLVCIKALHALTGLGLKEIKDIVCDVIGEY